MVLDAVAILERSGMRANGNRSPRGQFCSPLWHRGEEAEHLKEEVSGEAVRKLCGQEKGEVAGSYCEY